MLSDALKEVKSFIFDDGIEKLSDEDIVEKVNVISEKHDVNPEISLLPFVNQFSMLKMQLMEKELDEAKAGADWLPAERHILWTYVNAATKVEKIKYTEAEEHIAEILQKSGSGIRYKFYEIKRKIKAGSSEDEVLSAPRKNAKAAAKAAKSANSTSTNVDNKDTKEKNTKSTTDVKNQSSSESKQLEDTKQILEQKNEDNTRSEVAFVSAEVIDTNDNVRKESINSHKNVENNQNELVTQPQSNKKKEKSLFHTLNGMFNNMKIIGQENESVESKEEFFNFLSGLERVTGMAAESIHTVKNYHNLEREKEKLEEQLEMERKDADSLILYYKEEAEKAKETQLKALVNQTSSIQEAFTVFKNTQTHFFGKDEFEKMGDFDSYEKRSLHQLEVMENAINQLANSIEELKGNEKRNNFMLDNKTGFLVTN